MAIPIKPGIGTKADFAVRPSIPSNQKQNSTEFNLLVNSVRANYERLILNWASDIATDTTLPVNQYVLYTGVIYRIITSYNVGNPLTWDAAKAVAVGGGDLDFADIGGDPEDNAALVAYVESVLTAGVVGVYNDRGNFDASVNAYPSSGGSGTAGAILKGDIWRISVAGTLPTSQPVKPSDTVRALVDTPGNTQANWAITQGNIDDSTQTQAEAVATGANTSSTTGLSNDRYTGELSLYHFIRKFITLAWTWTLKQTFTAAPRFSSVTASEVLVVDSNKDLSSASYASLLALIDAADVLNAVAISSGTLTLAWGSASKKDFDLTTTASGNFTIAFTGSNMRRGRLLLRVTGTIVITMPSACVMDLYEKSVGRWDDSANTLTIIGVTASPFYITFEKDSAGNIWVHCTNRGV